MSLELLSFILEFCNSKVCISVIYWLPNFDSSQLDQLHYVKTSPRTVWRYNHRDFELANELLSVVNWNEILCMW